MVQSNRQSEEIVEEIQSDIPDIIAQVRNLLSDLECAESCDTAEDLCDNLRSAISKATEAKQELSKLLKLAVRVK